MTDQARRECSICGHGWAPFHVACDNGDVYVIRFACSATHLRAAVATVTRAASHVRPETAPPSRQPTDRAPRAAHDEVLRRAADTYREAVRRRDPAPTATTGRQMGYSRAHAGRLLVQARRAGLLPETRSGRARA